MGGCTVNMRAGAGKAVSGKGSVREGSVQRSRLAIHRKTGNLIQMHYEKKGLTEKMRRTKLLGPHGTLQPRIVIWRTDFKSSIVDGFFLNHNQSF